MDARQLMERLPVVASTQLAKGHERFYAPKLISIVRAAADLRIQGDWAEFGVHRGETARLMLDLLPFDSRLHLFDSFEGLPEDWTGPFKAGHFALPPEAVPVFEDARVSVTKGWFSDTLPGYFDPATPLALAHIDGDLYSSAWDCLSAIEGSLRPGSILLFDEYYLQHGQDYRDDEHRAFTEWMQVTGRRCRYLWRTEWRQVAAEVL